MLACNKPIVATGEMKAVSITPHEDGYLYDFGYNCVGLSRLTIKGNYGPFTGNWPSLGMNISRGEL